MAYYVMGIITVAWALLLAALGLTRPSFPPSGAGQRAIIAISVVLVAGTIGALMATTHKEHPRIEAAEAAERAAAGERELERTGKDITQSTQQKELEKHQARQARTVSVAETEFEIDLASGKQFPPGKLGFDVSNDGEAPHDLAIEGRGVDDKTPILQPGETAKLSVDLKPGTYKLYCTVPGHEEAGMKTNITVE
jgi:uncharacterized cupredoxin-like copper-binding protein